MSDSSKPKHSTRSIDVQRKELERLLKNPKREIIIPPVKSRKRALSPPPEIVSNVPSSSAGAGSGEFHIYKAARRKEYERLKIFEEEAREESSQREFREKQQTVQHKDQEKRTKTERGDKKKAGTDSSNSIF